jgi:NitT/TauT family transport system substrate-binding protein
MSALIHRFSGARRRVLALAAGLGLVCSTLALPAHAEGRIRIAEQFGVVYLLLNVAQDQ